jgi:hypothetical protein
MVLRVFRLIFGPHEAQEENDERSAVDVRQPLGRLEVKQPSEGQRHREATPSPINVKAERITIFAATQEGAMPANTRPDL